MTRAALIMFLAMSFIPAGDAAGKMLTGQGVSPFFVSWTRFGLGMLMVLPFYGRAALPLFADWRIWLRGALLATGITLIQTALATAPLGDVFAAFFIGPIFSYVLAGILLHEPMTRLRTAMLVLGFGGVVLVVRPGFSAEPGLVFAVLAGLFYGAFLTASRWVSGIAHPGALIVTQLAIGAAVLTPFGWNTAPEMTVQIATLAAASALFSMLGNLILLYAYRLAPATALAPFIYFQLFAAVLLGWLVFEDLPDPLTWAGIALILIAGVVAARAK